MRLLAKLSPLIAVFLFSCQTVSHYDETAYNNVISVKVDAWSIMGKATSSYDSNKDAIDTFNVSLRKAYEYDKNRPLNKDTTKMWEILMDPAGHSLGGFFTEWQKKGSIPHQVYIQFRQKQIGLEFDEIASAEQGKLHEK